MVDYFKRAAIEREKKVLFLFIHGEGAFVTKVCRWQKCLQRKKDAAPYWGQKWVEMISVVPKGSWEV